MNILIFGGNRYFGKEIVKKLILKNNCLYLVNRGNLKNVQSKKIKLIKLDRNKITTKNNIFKNIIFDVVLDNSSYDVKSVKKVFKLLDKNMKHYIYTSSILSYMNLSYKNFVDEKSWYKKKNTKNMRKNYNEGIIRYGLKKEKAEKFIINQKSISYTILRPHTVIGKDDFSLRTKNFLKFNFKLLNFNKKQFIQFCYKEDLIQIIMKLIYKRKKNSNVYNVCNDAISIADTSKILKNSGKNKFGFPLPIDALMSNRKICKSLNFKFKNSLHVIRKLKENN